MVKERKQHLLGLIMLSATAIFWGAGFILNDQLLSHGFGSTPNLINATRFGVSAIILAIVFCRQLKFNKKILLFGAIGGAMLFAGFTLQIYGLKMSTPSHNGFFTAAYIIFVPFIAWIVLKKRPNWIMFTGIGIAIIGLVILNFFRSEDAKPNSMLGDILTFTGALMFAAQIVWTDLALKKDVDAVNMTVWQCIAAGILFVLYTAIFERKNCVSIDFDARYDIWRLAITTLCGTAFAYFSQSFAQNYLNSCETSIILACESPIGAVLSILCGIELFHWSTLVGGLLVIAAAVIIEIIPTIITNRKQRRQANKEIPQTVTPPEENSSPNDEPPTE